MILKFLLQYVNALGKFHWILDGAVPELLHYLHNKKSLEPFLVSAFINSQ